MKSVGLVQIFCPVKETNRTHSQSYVEDLSTKTGRKRWAKTTVLNLSVLPSAKEGNSQKVEDQFLSLLSYVAEQEHNKIRMRQREEINIAQRKGGRFG